MIGNFTVEETNLIAIYFRDTREETIAEIAAALPDMGEDIKPIAVSAIRKLAELEEQEYAQAAFIPADETDG